MTRARAIQLRAVIEQAAQTLDEETISEAPELCRTLKQDGSLVRAGTRINWNGTIKKAAVDIWDTEVNDPDHAPSLWTDIAFTTAFSKGEKGWWTDGKLYESKVDSNVYTPAQYADNWKEIST